MKIKEQLTKVKNFASKHKTIIVGVTSFAAGVVGMVIVDKINSNNSYKEGYGDGSASMVDNVMITGIALLNNVGNDINKYKDSIDVAKVRYDAGPLDDKDDYLVGMATAMSMDITSKKEYVII